MMNVREITPKDYDAIAELEQIKWGDEAATHEQIKLRAEKFSLGSILVETADGTIVGYAAAQLVNSLSTKSWSKQTDNGNIVGTHQEDGQLAYGVGMSGIKNGVADAIIGHYYEMFIASGRCSSLCLGSRLPGFSKWHAKNKGDIKQYLANESGGLSRDPELRLYQQNGFNFLWEIEDYFPDQASLDYGAMIVRR